MDTSTATPTSHSFATAVRQALRAKGWSQKHLASFLEKDASTVGLWLAGRHKPRPDEELTIKKLAQLLDQEPAAVRALLAASPDGPPEEGTERPGRVMILTTLEDCKRIFTGNAAGMLAQVLAKHAAPSVTGLQESLYEHGYSIREDLLREFLHTHLPAQGYDWDRERQVFLRRVEENAVAWPIALTWHRTIVRQVCTVLNDAFAATADETLEKSEVLKHIQPVLPSDPDRQWPLPDASTLLQVLLDSHLLRDHTAAGKDRVQRRWWLSPEFVINRMWGIRPHIPGLDFLLDGGLLPPTAGGLSILIEGRPGTGKTSFALQMATSIAVQGCAVYLSAEENLARLVERLAVAGYTYEQVPSETSAGIVTRTAQSAAQSFALVLSDTVDPVQTGAQVKAQWQQGRGTLVLVALPNRMIVEPHQHPLLRNLRLLLETCMQSGMRSGYAVDSLDAVLPTGGRRLYESLFTWVDRSIGLFLSEEPYELHEADERRLRAHLVDMVIHLSQQVSDAPGHPLQRCIEITKSRSQHHRQGQHLFAIRPGEGLVVYPSIQARLSVWMQRIRRVTIPEPERWVVKQGEAQEFDLTPVLQQDVVRGSAILLTGPSATHKLPLSLTFLASQLEAEPASQVLLISLQDDEVSLLKIIETYPQLGSLLSPQPGSLHPNLHVLYRPPGYFTAPRFMAWVRQHLHAMRQRPGAGEVRRVLFNNLNQLRHSSPLFAEEPLFVAALLELFRKEQLTALFVQVLGDDPRSQDVFNTLLLTDHGPTPDPDIVQFRVGHTTRCDAYRELCWLQRVRELDGEGKSTGRGSLKLLSTLPPNSSNGPTRRSSQRKAPPQRRL